MVIKRPAVSGWYSSTFTGPLANTLINRAGITQFRLRFATDDNNNSLNNYLKFFSGDALAAQQPILIIQYKLP